MIHLDYETFSACDLRKSGMYRYAEDKTTEPLCLSYAFDDEEPELWTPYQDEPSRLFKALRRGVKYAGHNVSFEILIWLQVCTRLYGWPRIDPNKAVDTAAACAMHSLPRSLEGACLALNLTQQKDTKGSKLIQKLCKPRKPSAKNAATRWTPETAPQDFEDLYSYCKQDVRSERELHSVLGELPAKEQRVWQLDREINNRGVGVDLEAIRNAIKIVDIAKKRSDHEASEIAGGAFASTNQREAVMRWAEQRGYTLLDYTADYIAEAVKDPDCPPDVKRVLEIRRSVSRTSTRKFHAILRSVCEDGSVKGTQLYHGAGTGRWAGRIIQPHNFPRPTLTEDEIDTMLDLVRECNYELSEILFGDVISALVSCIRGVIVPKSGFFNAGDFSNVESRVLLWCADDQDGLRLFTSGLDLYKDMATVIFAISYEEVDSHQRRIGKLAILGLGYGMGVDKFILTAKEQAGLGLDKAFADKVVSAYREKYYLVVEWWGKLNKAAMQAVTYPGKRFKAGPVSFIYGDNFLKMRLPSGRNLFYPFPEIRMASTPWGRDRATLTYMVEEKKHWRRAKTFGGKLAENAVQAISRDLLVEAMFRVEEGGFPIAFTVHDEIVSEKSEHDSEKLKELMNVLPEWAEGMPITCDTWSGQRFRK